MRLPDTEHTSRPWRIHKLTRDFRLEDVWALPTPGGPGDFPRLVQAFTAGDPSRGPARVLFTIRSKLGEVLGWDSPDAGFGSRVRTLRDRLPADLRDAPGPDFAGSPFTSLYLLGDEFAAEIANRTVHGVLHLGWVPDGMGGYRGQLAVLVKPNGLLGTGYLAAIMPFRRLAVYPLMMRNLARQWRDRPAQPAAARSAEMAVAPDATGPRDGTAGTVRPTALPPGARALSTLARIDYHDAFAVEAVPAGDRTGEQWARAVLAGAPRMVRLKLVCGWYALGLKLRSPWSGRGMLGWEVRRSTPDFVLLGAGSRIGMPAELLFMREPRGLLFATFASQQNRMARAVWARTVPAHQRIVQSLLAQAARRPPK